MAQILSLAISSLLFKLSMEFQMLSIILFISVSLIWFFFSNLAVLDSAIFLAHMSKLLFP